VPDYASFFVDDRPDSAYNVLITELHFLVQEDDTEGGFVARAVGESITTQADTEAELKEAIRDAVLCHFEVGKAPKIIRLHYAREEVLRLLDL